MIHDLKLVLRQWLRSPGFVVVSTLTLALGVGANLALISLASGMFLRPLPGLGDVSRLMTLGRVYPGGMSVSAHASHPQYRQLRETQDVFEEVAAYSSAPFNLAGRERGDRVRGELVSANYFRTLGVRMRLGRDFRAEEDEVPGRDAVVVVSERLWRERWGADPGIVGTTLVINTHPFTVVGVAGGGFRGYQLPTGQDLWIPLAMAARVQGGSAARYSDDSMAWIPRLVGRLKPGVDERAVAAQMEVLSSRMAAAARETDARNVPRWQAVPYSPFPSFDKRRPMLFVGVLIGLTGLVLGVVCANVAALFLSRALARQREAAIRLALGSGRGRLLRQAMLEGGVIALLGVGVGTLIALRLANGLVGMIPGDDGEPVVLRAVLDGRLALAGLALALMSGLGVSLIPAWRLSRVPVVPVLKSAAQAVTGRRSRGRSMLVVTQVALSLVLVVAGVLLYRSLGSLQRWDPGLQTDGLLTAQVDPGLNGFEAARVDRFAETLLQRLAEVPGVQAASLSSEPPLQPGFSTRRVSAEAAGGAPDCTAIRHGVAPGFFRTLGIALLQGREFETGDRRDGPRVAIVDESLAAALWPGGTALGQWLHGLDDSADPLLVVGVVRRAKYAGPDVDTRRAEHQPVFYVPLAQTESRSFSVLVRTAGDPWSLLGPVRESVHALDPHVPLFHPATGRTLRAATFWQQRLAGGLVGAGGGLALSLALLGLFATVSQEVARRRREIGVRLAVGATAGDIVRLLMRGGLGLVGVGAAVGLGLAWGASRLVGGAVPGVSAGDPVPLGAGLAIIVALATVATWVAARRAAEVAPAEVLRADG